MESEEELRRVARERAKRKADFYVHLAVYLAVNAFLVVLWWATGGGFPWFVFPLFGWGIGIAAHFMEAFIGHGFVDRIAEREYERLRRRR
jgi:hypothetical protein